MGGSSYSDDAADRLYAHRATVDPSTVFVNKSAMAANLDPKGVKVRESRDSDAHPESNACAIFFDVTGSMGGIPRQFAMETMPGLMKLLVTRGYLPHPQIFFGAVGDATSDRAPLQVGQFESGLEMDECLTSIFIEGNGGGQSSESYEMALYFAARHFSIDSWEKRGKKPYLFTIGDEMAYKKVDRDLVKKFIGDDIEASIPLKDMLEEINSRFEYFHICVNSPSYHDGHHKWWKELLNERALMLEDPKGVCELIGLTISACEGRDIDDAGKDLVDSGLSASRVDAAKAALVPFVGAGTALRKGTVSGDLQVSADAGGSRRL